MKRLNVDIDQGDERDLQAIMKALGTSKKTEAVRRMIRLTSAVLKTAKDGKVYMVSGKEVETIIV